MLFLYFYQFKGGLYERQSGEKGHEEGSEGETHPAVVRLPARQANL